MAMAKAGRYNGYLLEGMACPGGCVAGAGTILSVEQAKKNINEYQKNAPMKSATESEYKHFSDSLD